MRASVAYVAILLTGTASLAWFPSSRVSGRGAEAQSIAFAPGTPVTQGFEQRANGLHAIRIQLASARGADVTFGYRLSLAAPGQKLLELRRSTHAITGLRGSRWVTLDFPAVEQSAGAWCELALHVIEARSLDGSPSPDVTLVAYRDRSLRPAMLRVGERERWGTLAFDAMADADTPVGRFATSIAPSAPGVLGHPFLLALLLGGYALLFLPLGAALLSAPPRDAPPTPRTRRPLAGVVVCILLAATAGTGMWVARAEHGQINLLDRIHDADIESLALARFVEVTTVEIDVGERRALFAHAPTQASWRIIPPASSVLRTAIAMSPGVWDRDSNGVQFSIRVRDGGDTAELFTRTMVPKQDRHWIPIEVDLSRFAGRSVDLMLVTDTLGDPAHDWALWDDPRVMPGARTP